MIFTIICFVIAALLVVVDQVTKVIAVDKLCGNGSYEFIPNVLHFTYVENDGMAFNLLKDHRWVYMVLSTLAIVGIIVFLIVRPQKSKILVGSLSLVVSGGIGNMIDRFTYVGVIGDTAGKHVVRDFIDVRMFGSLWPWVFNVADACVTVGGAVLLCWCLVSLIKEYVEENKAKKLAAAVVEAVEAKTENKDEDKSEDNEEN